MKNNPGGGDLLQGQYSNYFEVGHNAFEFLLDFGQLHFEEAEGRMHTRIITSPVFAKRLVEVLNRAFCEYEKVYGPVEGEADEPDDAKTAKVRHIHAVETP